MNERTVLNLTHLVLLKAEAKRWPKPRSGWKTAWRKIRRWWSMTLVVGALVGVASSADAIVTLCGPGYPCHPQTGVCWTGWEACHYDGGKAPCVPHPECSSDPSTCFEAFYEQPPGVSDWGISPAPFAQNCELAQSALLAAMKNDSPTQWQGLRNYTLRIEKRLSRITRKLAQGSYGNPLSSRYAAAFRRRAWLITLGGLLWGLVADPANPNYAALPGPGVFPPVGLPGPDATLTQAQLNGWSTWLTAQREVVITARQLTDTTDNLAGAILAAEAGAPGAAEWVRRLAWHADTVTAQLVQRGLAEIAARSSVIGPVVVESADCSTPTDTAEILPIAVQQHSSLYHGHLLYEDFVDGPICDVAATFPALLVADAPDDTATWTAFGAFGFADWLCTHGGYCTPRFADVLTTHPFYAAIESIAMAGITGGCSTAPPLYCPDSTITRDQMAVFLLRGKHGAGYTPPAAQGIFSDVPTSYWAATWIERLVAEGFTGGCGTNPLRFCPMGVVTRDQMAVFLLRLRHGGTYQPPAVGASTGFADVPISYWAAPWIKQLALEGITSGCGGGTYCPTAPVTRGQMAVFLQRALGLP